MAHRQPTIDGFRPRKPAIKQSVDKIYVTPLVNDQQKKNIRKAKPELHLPPKRQMIVTLTIMLTIIGSTIIGAQLIAELIIMIFGVVAIIRHIPSRIIFCFAIATLSSVLVSQIINQPSLATAFASYTFLLLAFGTVCLSRELSKV